MKSVNYNVLNYEIARLETIIANTPISKTPSPKSKLKGTRWKIDTDDTEMNFYNRLARRSLNSPTFRKRHKEFEYVTPAFVRPTIKSPHRVDPEIKVVKREDSSSDVKTPSSELKFAYFDEIKSSYASPIKPVADPNENDSVFDSPLFIQKVKGKKYKQFPKFYNLDKPVKASIDDVLDDFIDKITELGKWYM